MRFSCARVASIVVGCLDLAKGPQVLHVPQVRGRYYSVQFTDPSDGAAFAYAGTRTTGSQAGDYLVTVPGWAGQAPSNFAAVARRSRASPTATRSAGSAAALPATWSPTTSANQRDPATRA